MVKRSWTNMQHTADSPNDGQLTRPPPLRSASHHPRQHQQTDDLSNEVDVPRLGSGSENNGATVVDQAVSARKAKACVACRKQKIKCFMDDPNPPCRRCAKKGFSCVINKSPIQSLLEESYLPFKDAVLQDLDTVYANMQQILGQLNLPPMVPLQVAQLPSGQGVTHTPTSQEPNDGPAPARTEPQIAGPSCDVSPSISPQDETDLPHVPIRSVYQLTKLSALRSPDATESAPGVPKQSDHGHDTATDLVSRGLLSQEDAERLFSQYISRLDHYMYGIVNSRYRHLNDVRRKSPILAAAILTVAAMHEPQSNDLYAVCSGEFRRLVTLSLLDRQVDRDYLRALCVASYWLNDISWVLSGVACRRAAEFDIASHYNRLVKHNDEDSADFVRVWYLIYICDQHLSTLYARECSSREDNAILGYEALLKLPGATTNDKRLASQIALLSMIHSIRELFGNDDTISQMNSAVLLTQIKGFSRQLDQWLDQWRATFPEVQEEIGSFPRKGALFHYYFAKLYLYSHTFRGKNTSVLPPELSEPAHGAVTAATSILNMIISDQDVRAGLVGLPAYIQSMTGFACMILARLACTHGDNRLVETGTVIDLISQLKQVYKATPVGKWHLVHLMPRGFDKVLATLQQHKQTEYETSPGGTIIRNGNSIGNYTLGQPMLSENTTTFMDRPMADLDPFFLLDDMSLDYSASQHMYTNQMHPGFMDPNPGFDSSGFE